PVGVSSVTYNNLSVSNTSAGGATPSAAISATNVTGNVTISSGGTFTAGAFSHVLGGNFTNNGTFVGTGSTMAFNAGSAQTIGGSSTTAFNNLTISDAANTVTLATSGTVAGDLNISAGTFDLGGNTINRTAS